MQQFVQKNSKRENELAKADVGVQRYDIFQASAENNKAQVNPVVGKAAQFIVELPCCRIHCFQATAGGIKPSCTATAFIQTSRLVLGRLRFGNNACE